MHFTRSPCNEHNIDSESKIPELSTHTGRIIGLHPYDTIVPQMQDLLSIACACDSSRSMNLLERVQSFRAKYPRAGRTWFGELAFSLHPMFSLYAEFLSEVMQPSGTRHARHRARVPGRVIICTLDRMRNGRLPELSLSQFLVLSYYEHRLAGVHPRARKQGKKQE